MAEISGGRQEKFDSRELRKRSAVDAVEHYFRHFGEGRHGLIFVVAVTTGLLGILRDTSDQKLKNRAIGTKAQALLALGEFGQAIRCLSSLDAPSGPVQDLLIKAQLLAGDALNSGSILSNRIQSLSELGSPNAANVELLGYRALKLLADSVNLRILDCSATQAEIAKLRNGFNAAGQTQDALINRFAFILGVVEAKCALVQGKRGPAAATLSYLSALLANDRNLDRSSAIMEYLAISGDIKLLQGNPKAAASYYTDLSVRFAFAEDSPTYFKRAVWGLIDSSAGSGRFDLLEQVKAVLARRSSHTGGPLANWCSAMTYYADARVGKRVDFEAWKDAIGAAREEGALDRSEGLAHHVRRAFAMTTAPGVSSNSTIRLGIRALAAVFEAIAAKPGQLGIMDIWRLSKTVDRWFLAAVTHGLETRAAAAEVIVKMLGAYPLFAGKAETYRLVARRDASSSRGSVEELVID